LRFIKALAILNVAANNPQEVAMKADDTDRMERIGLEQRKLWSENFHEMLNRCLNQPIAVRVGAVRIRGVLENVQHGLIWIKIPEDRGSFSFLWCSLAEVTQLTLPPCALPPPKEEVDDAAETKILRRL
jgi:hypothetical protein